MIFPRSLSLTLAALAVTTSAIAQTTVKWVPLNQDPPPAVLSATPVGPKPSGDILHITVAMPYADPVGMKQFADSVSNPASPNYRQFLTPAQIGLRFGQPTSVVQQVQNYLAAQGMTVKLVAATHIAITADCTVAQAEAAFNTNFENYTVLDNLSTGPQSRFSFTTAPSLPASISTYVNCIGGLESFLRPKPRLTTADRLIFVWLYRLFPSVMCAISII